MKVYELLDKPEKWCKGQLGRNSRKIAVHPLHKSAVCWCLAGAFQKCYTGNDDYQKIRSQLTNKLNVEYIYHWNDDPERTYEEVIALCKKLDI